MQDALLTRTERFNRVAAVVVTHDRPVLLRECLEALTHQTRLPDSVVVVDNASAAETCSAFDAVRYHNPHLSFDYVRSDVNLGGAGGFALGMSRALSLDCAWIWLMDDDAAPCSEALAELLGACPDDTRSVSALASVTVGVDGLVQPGHQGYINFRSFSKQPIIPIFSGKAESKNTCLPIDFSSFVGLCVHRDAVRSVGLPRGDFFIRHDDLEYCLRLARYAPLYLAPASRIVHKDARTALGSGSLKAERTLFRGDLWIAYLDRRNFTWVALHALRGKLRRCEWFYLLMRIMGQMLRHESRKLMGVLCMMLAFFDGWRSCFDISAWSARIVKRLTARGLRHLEAGRERRHVAEVAAGDRDPFG